MPVIAESIIIRAPAAALFDLTQDYDRRLDWDPFLREARLVGGAAEAGVGVRAWCVARSGLGMETEYVSFRAPEVVAVKMTRGPAILASFAGSWRFKELGGDQTEVTFRYSLRAAPRALAFALEPILRLVFRRDVRQRLKALKRAVEQKGVLIALS
jgi:ribosome-associated toxin RatA of RatAB toxin-antitoxin module